MELAATVISIIKENCDYSDEIQLNDHLINDLNIDSFDILMITNAVEDEFNIDIQTEELKELQSVKDIVDKLEDKLTVKT